MTTQTPPRLPEFYRQNARVYLQSLKSGQKPDIRPEFDIWEPVIQQAEKSFHVFKPEQRPVLMPKALESIRKMPKFGGLDVATLLVEPTAEQAKIEPSAQDQDDSCMPPLPVSAQLDPELGKNACPLMDIYIEFSQKASYRAFNGFHPFAFLILASAVIAGRAFLQIKLKKFYSNLMIIFCAATSFYAKSFTVKIVKDCLRASGLNHLIGPNRVTAQKLLSNMARYLSNERYADASDEEKDNYKRKIAMAGQKVLFVDENGLLFNDMFARNSTNGAFIDILLEFYDCNPYTNETVTRDSEPIDNPYLTWQGNCTPDNAKVFAKPGSPFWGTGLGARCDFVVAPPPQRQTQHAIDDDDNDDLPIPPIIIDELKHLHQRLGIPTVSIEEKVDDKGKPTGKFRIIPSEDFPENRVRIAPDARRAWHNYEKALEELQFDLKITDFRGSYTRLAESAMRIAVILAVVNGTDYITLPIWALAQELAETLRSYLHELWAQINATDESAINKLRNDILEYLTAHPGQSVSDLQQKATKIKNNRYADASTIKSILSQLENDEIVKSSKAGKTGRKKIYSIMTEGDSK